MDFKVTGAITQISEVVKGKKKDGSGEWQKLSFAIKTPDQYNNLYAFEVFGEEKVQNFNQYNKVGQNVEVSFNIRTNEWQGKFYTSLQAWKVFKADAAAAPAKAMEEVPTDDLPDFLK